MIEWAELSIYACNLILAGIKKSLSSCYLDFVRPWLPHSIGIVDHRPKKIPLKIENLLAFAFEH